MRGEGNTIIVESCEGKTATLIAVGETRHILRYTLVWMDGGGING